MHSAVFGLCVAVVTGFIWCMLCVLKSISLFPPKSTIPLSFQVPFRAIVDCINQEKVIEAAEKTTSINGSGLRCFVANKEALLNIAQVKFNPIIKENYDKCLDMIPLIGNELNVIQAVQSCTINSHKLDATVSELFASRASSKFYSAIVTGILGCTLMYLYFGRNDYLNFKVVSPKKDLPILNSKEVIQNPITSPTVKDHREQTGKQTNKKVILPLKGSPLTNNQYQVNFHEFNKVKEFQNTPLPNWYTNENHVFKVEKVDPYKYSAEVYQADTSDNKPSWKTSSAKLASENKNQIVAFENESTPKKPRKAAVMQSKSKKNVVDTTNVLEGLKDFKIDIGGIQEKKQSNLNFSQIEKPNKDIIQQDFKKQIKKIVSKSNNEKKENLSQNHLSVQVALTAIESSSPIKSKASGLGKINTSFSKIKPFVPAPMGPIPFLPPGLNLQSTNPMPANLSGMPLQMVSPAASNGAWNKKLTVPIGSISGAPNKADAEMSLNQFKFNVPLKQSTCSLFSSPYSGSIWNDGPVSAVTRPEM